MYSTNYYRENDLKKHIFSPDSEKVSTKKYLLPERRR